MANKPLVSIAFPDLPDTYTIPQKTSDLTNDSGFITASGAPVQSVNGQTGAVTVSGLSQEAKRALMDCFANTAWAVNNGQTYYDALASALGLRVLSSIAAVFTQGSATIYDTDSLDTLKQYLVVTANYSDSTTATVTDYTLSGTLTTGTSTITVSYGGKTTTFNVTVTEAPLWTFTDGYSVGKATSGTYARKVYRQSTAARACGAAPIENKGYVFTVTDSSKYNIVAYDVTSMEQITPAPTAAIDGYCYQGGTKSIAWGTSDSVTSAYVWVSLRKMDGTAFTAAELANGAEAVFTYTEAT